MLRRSPSLLALPLLLTLWPAAASADEKNAAVQACEGKSEGATCTNVRMIKGNEGNLEKRESPGTCQTDECCELDYSKGSPPETTCGPCLACKAGGPRPTPHAPDVSGGDDGGGGDGAGDGGAAEGGPPAANPNEKRGCTVGGTAAPWWALLMFGAVLARRRYGNVQD